MTVVESDPEGWQVVKLGDLAIISAGGTPSRSNPSFWNGDIPWVTTAEVNNSVITKTEETISRLGLQSSAAKLLPGGTLLLALYGQGKTRGKVAILGIEAATNQACASIRIKDSVSKTFVFHALDSKYSEIRALSNSGSQENLSGAIVRSIELLIPSLPEQRAIAEALSDVDSLITALNALIAKKRAIKLATMQQLLTGRTRLPGFEGEWVARKLGDVLTLQRGFDLPLKQRGNGNFPVVSSSGVSGTHDQAHVKAPGIVTGRCGTIGEVFYVTEDFWPLNTTLYVRDFKGNDPLFLSYLLRTIDFQAHGGKTGVPVVNRNDLHELNVHLPGLVEQRAIAQVLSDMDAEIEALEARVAKTRDIKQGMMQQLLTGRIRLVPPTPEEVPA